MLNLLNKTKENLEEIRDTLSTANEYYNFSFLDDCVQKIESKIEDIVMQTDKLEKPKKRNYNKVQQKAQQNPNEWSRKYDKCVACGSTENKHKANGFCIKCYSPKKVKHYIETGEILRKKNVQKLDDNQPVSSAAKKYKCEECNAIFTSVLDYLDVKCVCGSTKIIKLP